MYWHPPVGVFIALLALIGVLVPWLKGNTVGPRERAIWTIVMFTLVALEIRSIYLDQAEHDKQQADARAAQLEQFQKIAAGLNSSITESQRQFGITVAGLSSALQIGAATMGNTAPKASLVVKGLFAFPDLSFPLSTTRTLVFNLNIENQGGDMATKVHQEVRVYVRRPGNIEDQRLIYSDLKKGWETRSKGWPAINAFQAVFSTVKFEPFTDKQITSLLSRTGALYYLVRLGWTDKTGTWIADSCHEFQDFPRDLTTIRLCEVGNLPRAAVP
jgi:hypothetical protein